MKASLESGVLHRKTSGAKNVIDFRVAIRTTVLLVDDNPQHLDLRAHTLKMYGFSVVNAISPQEAISIMNESSSHRIDVVVLDYHMPGMNGCILAEYLKTRYPDLKIVLYSGTLEIPEQEMSSIDVFVPKVDGIVALLGKIAEFEPMEAANSPFLAAEDNYWIDALN
jgi:CheY-like chemotaxis protein